MDIDSIEALLAEAEVKLGDRETMAAGRLLLDAGQAWLELLEDDTQQEWIRVKEECMQAFPLCRTGGLGVWNQCGARWGERSVLSDLSKSTDTEEYQWTPKHVKVTINAKKISRPTFDNK